MTKITAAVTMEIKVQNDNPGFSPREAKAAAHAHLVENFSGEVWEYLDMVVSNYDEYAVRYQRASAAREQ